MTSFGGRAISHVTFCTFPQPLATISPTATGTRTLTPTLTPTPRPSDTPQPTPTPEATPTPGVRAVGRGMALTYLGGRQVRVSWQPGFGDPIVVRISPEGAVPLAPSDRTSHVDSLAVETALACYLVIALHPTQAVIARSDLECVLPGTASGFAVRNFSLRLNQSPVARLDWEGAPGATGYVLLPIGTERVQLP